MLTAQLVFIFLILHFAILRGEKLFQYTQHTGEFETPSPQTDISKSIALEGSQLTRQFRRGVGCSEITTSTYVTNGTIFDIQCGSYWAWYDEIYTTWTTSFSACINYCISWNLQNSNLCVGVSWYYDQFGPDGSSAGSQCYLLWQLLSDSNGTWDSVDSAVIRGTPAATNLELSTSDTECISGNGTIYQTTTGAEFEIYCGINWASGDLYISYTTDFTTCIENCAKWNENTNNTVCLGIAYAPQNYGPDETQFECYFKWELQNGSSYSLVDSAILVPAKTQNGTAPSSPSPSSTSSADLNSGGLSAAKIGGIAGGVVGGSIVVCLLLAILLCGMRWGPLVRLVQSKRTSQIGLAPLASGRTMGAQPEKRDEAQLGDEQEVGGAPKNSLEHRPGGRLQYPVMEDASMPSGRVAGSEPAKNFDSERGK